MHSWMSCTSEIGWRRAAVWAPILLGMLFGPGCTEPTGEPDDEEGEVITSVQALSTTNGLALNGLALNGLALNGISLNGISLNGLALNGVSIEGTTFVGKKASGKPMKPEEFVGATFTGTLSNGQTITLRIEDRVASTRPDVFLYEVAYLSSPSQGAWKSLCGETSSGTLRRAIPLAGTWDYSERKPTSGMHLASETTFTFACRPYAIAKCVELGYKPWGGVKECVAPGICKEIPGVLLHQACTRMLRADYCGDGVPHTQDGTIVDVWDDFGIQASVVTDFAFEAEWTPMGARCIEHTRWHGDTSGATASYVDKHCSSRWSSVQPSYDCGGPSSTLHTAKGFAIPPLVRSLIGNESALPGD
ncbi:ADYC domain-containing protein [Polyangium jinanense]|uniref:Pentapeptide repeat-containing protein n=1 Tax=Polyangium jinanense TaxID=2829994 RepID=A0A9X3X5U6_9BACT|nr:ADYC domain-containing protein [Polyangium jinanense]MDC3984299.1 pentapeptide repeat-containing protein [Polyangium jinanense]